MSMSLSKSSANRFSRQDKSRFLAEAFSTSPEFWLNLQASHDLSRHRQERHVEPLVVNG